jgi:uncharacterized protein YijF (DUF1287 family)
MVNRRIILSSTIGLAALSAAGLMVTPASKLEAASQVLFGPAYAPPEMAADLFAKPEPWAVRLIAAGPDQIGRFVAYDAAFEPIGDQGGAECTDVIVRGAGTQIEDVIFAFPITGRYSFKPGA